MPGDPSDPVDPIYPIYALLFRIGGELDEFGIAGDPDVLAGMHNELTKAFAERDMKLRSGRTFAEDQKALAKP